MKRPKNRKPKICLCVERKNKLWESLEDSMTCRCFSKIGWLSKGCLSDVPHSWAVPSLCSFCLIVLLSLGPRIEFLSHILRIQRENPPRQFVEFKRRDSLTWQAIR
uniref:hypothetical protein n=1 Tax=Bidens bipinnata TaxID=1527831 RepID=UPI001EDF2602|nr:hypothetical protein MFQ52_mgp13 [Bidens bipinnata]YP_010352730.1 hypothetical protein MFU86_mgp13 [Bidens biternata]YP_010352748.1 hypothetical protein MZG22_mgp57 [Bidens pilosa]UIR99377.1 hypothetical protein [Bidens alba var. radiata]UIR99084.1 hypothetical protein [Bidens bipinnata]UIR99147.1 hypothetical protein [Bidens biternata]UIR99209.1 hypothetical protein [Bidens biternata]UIR99226.1 hypothetical protein [Bidens pilosa]